MESESLIVSRAAEIIDRLSLDFLASMDDGKIMLAVRGDKGEAFVGAALYARATDDEISVPIDAYGIGMQCMHATSVPFVMLFFRGDEIWFVKSTPEKPVWITPSINRDGATFRLPIAALTRLRERNDGKRSPKAVDDSGGHKSG